MASVIENILGLVGWQKRSNRTTSASQENFKAAISISSETDIKITSKLIASTYTENAIARRLVNDLTIDIIKAGFDFECSAESAREIELAKRFEELYLPEIRTLLQIQAIYGSALIVVNSEKAELENELEAKEQNFKFEIYPPYNDESFLFNAKFGFEIEEVESGEGGDYNLFNKEKTKKKKIHKSRCIEYRGEGLFLDDLPNGMLYPIVKNILNHSSYLAMELKTAKRGTLTLVSVDNEKMINNSVFTYFTKPPIKDFAEVSSDTQESMKENLNNVLKSKNETLPLFAEKLAKAKNGDILTVDDCFKVESQNILVNDFSRQIAKEEDMIAIGSGVPFTILLGKHSGNFGSGGSGSDNSYSQMYRSKIFAEQEIFKRFLKDVLNLYFKLNGIYSPIDFKIRMKSPYPETAKETAERKRLETEAFSAKIQAFNSAMENSLLDLEKTAEEIGIENLINEAELKAWEEDKNKESIIETGEEL